jgi:excisionase family DNA binding protein
MASAAVATDLSEKTVQRAIRSGALRAKKVGRGVRILRPDLEEWLATLPDA